jgi:hypothetical protein
MADPREALERRKKIPPPFAKQNRKAAQPNERPCQRTQATCTESISRAVSRRPSEQVVVGRILPLRERLKLEIQTLFFNAFNRSYLARS